MSTTLTDSLPPVTVVPDDAPYADLAEEIILQRLATHWMPREILPAEQWLYQNLRLEKNMTSEFAGEPYDIRNVPHARLIFDFLRDPVAEELNVMKSSAAAMSTAVIAAITYYFWLDPRNIIYLISNQDEARKLSKQVMQPFLRQVFGTVIDDEDQANLHLHVNGAELFFGSPTEAMMRNKQVWLVVEDESDTMEDRLSGGGQDLETAAKERTKNTRGRKIIRLCTPLYRYNSKIDKRIDQPGTRIHRNFLRGDQREWRVPCIACENEHPILRGDMQIHHCRDLAGAWDLDLMREATQWKCPSCGHLVHDSSKEKRAMMVRGSWAPTATARSRRIWSAHHTDMCALIGNATWGEIMAAYHETESDPIKRAAVLRSHFGEPEDLTDAGSDRTKEIIVKHCGAYKRGTCPIIPDFVGIAADVQKDASYFPWMTAAFDITGGMYIIDCGEANDTAELEQIFHAPIPLAVRDDQRPMLPDKDGKLHPAQFAYCTHGVMDSGHSATEDEADPKRESVYRFCAGTFAPGAGRFRWVPLKGRGGRQIKDMTEDSTARINSGVVIPLHHFHDSLFKRILYHIRLSDPDAPHSQKKVHPHIRFFREHDADEADTGAGIEDTDRFITFDAMVAELISERIMEMQVKRGGFRRLERRWGVPSGLKNNLGDCAKMLTVLSHLRMRTHAQHAILPPPEERRAA